MLLLRSFVSVTSVDAGFETTRLLTWQINLPANLTSINDRLAFYRDFFARMEALPGVVSVGGTTRVPLGSRSVAATLQRESVPLPLAELPEVQFQRAMHDLLPNDGHSDPADAASIRTTARPHTWGEERIAAELRVKLGMTLSPRTVRRYMPSRSRGGRSAWNLTDHPAAAWTTQQFRNGLPLDSAYRLLVHDRDGVFACGGRGPSVDVASGAEDAGTCRASECTL